MCIPMKQYHLFLSVFLKDYFHLKILTSKFSSSFFEGFFLPFLLLFTTTYTICFNHISVFFKDQLKSTMDKLLENFLVELPKLPDELCISPYEPSTFEIEPDWNKFVGETFAQSLPKTVAKQQMAIWELLTTEASHIKTTKIIIDVFLSCLVSLKCHETTGELFR